MCLRMTLNSAVVTATRYGLKGQGIESQWGRKFLHPCTSAPGPTQPPEFGANYPNPPTVEAKETAKLYLYSPLCAFMTCYRVNLRQHLKCKLPTVPLATMICQGEMALRIALWNTLI